MKRSRHTRRIGRHIDRNPEFVVRLADRAQDAERLRRLPPATIDDPIASCTSRGR
jgi:hypothetical protein